MASMSGVNMGLVCSKVAIFGQDGKSKGKQRRNIMT